MNYVAFDPEVLAGEDREWWVKWQEKATNAALAAIEQAENGKEICFQSAVWSELKRWLLQRVFHSKCAYCETNVEVTEYGDADHYRPKGRVAEADKHVGYYWVAYDWRNLVPCCKRCNIGGKRDSFPIEGRRVFSRQEVVCLEDLDVIEKPLLLHPYSNGKGDPRKHLEFNEFGHVKPRFESIRGKVTIKLCDLTREPLVQKRREHQEYAWIRFLNIIERGGNSSERQAFLQKFIAGIEEHSAACSDFVHLHWDQCSRDIGGLAV